MGNAPDDAAASGTLGGNLDDSMLRQSSRRDWFDTLLDFVAGLVSLLR